MSDRADMIMGLVRNKQFAQAATEIDAMETDLMQHASEIHDLRIEAEELSRIAFDRESRLSRDVHHLRRELAAALEDARVMKNCWDAACNDAAELLEAAKAVCWFDWSDNDTDAVMAINRLRSTIGVRSVQIHYVTTPRGKEQK